MTDEEKAEFEITDDAFRAASEAYDKADYHTRGLQDAIRACLDGTPDWMIERYSTARRMEME